MRQWLEWQWEPLLRLVMGICLLLGASSLGVLVLMKVTGQTGGGIEFPAMIWHTVVFHGGTVLLVALFLKEQRLSWREGFWPVSIRWAGLTKAVLITTVLCLVGAQLLGRISAWLIEWATGEEPTVQTTVTLLQDSRSIPRLAYLALMTVVMAPVAEELLFRGILYRALYQYRGRWVAIVVSSVVFGLIHANVLTLAPLTVVAVFLALLYERTGNLIAPVLAHSLFNLTNFVLLLTQGE